MKHFIAHITTEFCGMEWGQTVLIDAEDGELAQQYLEGTDWTHADGIETQEVGTVQEVPEEHYQVLSQYLPCFEDEEE